MSRSRAISLKAPQKLHISRIKRKKYHALVPFYLGLVRLPAARWSVLENEILTDRRNFAGFRGSHVKFSRIFAEYIVDFRLGKRIHEYIQYN